MLNVDCEGLVAESPRKYSEELAEETFGLPEDEVTPVAIREELPPLKDLRVIPRDGRLGGKLSSNLKELSDEEAAVAKERAEEFLKQPPVHYAAEGDSVDSAEGERPSDEGAGAERPAA